MDMNTDMMIAELVEAALSLPEPNRSLFFRDLLLERFESMSQEELKQEWDFIFAEDN
jgi:hypothetical protein